MFFSELIPQPSGAAFAGVKLALSPPQDLTGNNVIKITGRGRGDNNKVKFHLRDGTLDANNEGGYYKANFTVRQSNIDSSRYINNNIINDIITGEPVQRWLGGVPDPGV